MAEIMQVAASCELRELWKVRHWNDWKGNRKGVQLHLSSQGRAIRKAKVLKKPKFDITKLMEVHEGSAVDAGKKMERDEAEVGGIIVAKCSRGALKPILFQV